MIALIQRVTRARVDVAGQTLAAIGAGLLVLLCAERGDDDALADKLLARLLKLRIFADAQGKMNRSVQDVGGGLLIVSQFTLAADCSGGNRPSFSAAAPPDEGPCGASGGGDGRFWRRHAGASGQRRASDGAAAHGATGLKRRGRGPDNARP